MKIGVLDIQGSVEEHFNSLQRINGVEAVLIKKISDLEGVKGLIMPGGESTTIGKLLKRFGLDLEIAKRFKAGELAIWGTCAGAILLAKEIVGREQADSLKLMDITIERNAYGRQVDSFETELNFNFEIEKGRGYEVVGKSVGKNVKSKEKNGEQKIPAIFIRAPKIKSVGKGVKILAKYEGEIVAAREGKLFATTFHPEMTDDLKVHQYFVKMCV